jgi:RecB family exonuclease
VSTFEAVGVPPVAWAAEHLRSLPYRPARRAVVLVAAERQAHALRRHVCIDCGRPRDLAGVLLLRPVELARELLIRAGRVCRPGQEDVRRLRILRLFESGALAGDLRYFNAEQLRSGQGYVDAFASTIADLEASGLQPELMAAISERIAGEDRRSADRLHDVAVTWQAVDTDRGTRVSSAQLLAQAADVVVCHPELAAAFGPVFAVLTASPSAALLRFLRALPGCRMVLQDARPLRSGTQRWRQLIGAGAVLPPSRKCVGSSPTSLSGGAARHAACRTDTELSHRLSELDVVQRFLFALPEVLTDPQRPRSSGPDGTVDLEEFASIEDEIEAAVSWVTEQIATETPLEQIALVVPETDAYAPLLIDRLGRLAHGPEQSPIRTYVAGGLRLSAFPAGMRLLAVLQAVARGLEAEATIRVLPALRRGAGDRSEGPGRLSPSRAAEIIYSAGILGGTPGDPAGVAEWVPRLTHRRDALRALLEGAEDASQQSGERAVPLNSRDRIAAERWLRDVEPILPAISELQGLAEDVVAGAPLSTLWDVFRRFGERWLRVPPLPPNVLDFIGDRLQPILDDAAAQDITGSSAVRFLMDVLRSERRPTARFGEPCVFIGTPSKAGGLPFAAVRVLGLAEGALPHTPHDDPIVPDGLRQQVEQRARELHVADVVVPRLADHVLDDMHDVFRVISGVRGRLALSAPRQWIDRSEREVSGIMLEVATALGRPGATPTDEGDVPTASRLRSVYLNAGREARWRYTAEHPLWPRAGLMVVSSWPATRDAGTIAVPADWMRDGALAIDQLWERLSAAEAASFSSMDGIITGMWATTTASGLHPQYPISASGLNVLLRCPHRFLLERVLHLKEPTTAPSADLIDPAVYGSLFHAAAERFYRESGAALCRREGTLEQWVARARAIAEEAFDELRHEYPMRGEDGIARERDRLLRQIEQMVQYEWELPAREFLESELSFGEPEAVRLALAAGDLYVRGKIDRVDRVGARALAIRDLKTGRVRDFGEERINAGRDLQIGLYVLALEASGYGGAPVGVAAYVHPSAAREPDRAFEGPSVEVLRRHIREWLTLARQLLKDGLFPRTPNPDDCKYCPFVPACGDGARERVALKLSNLPAADPLEPFARFKRQESESAARG